jgi:LPS export ABC transporter protein LptC
MRAKLPGYVRIAAIAGLALTILAIGLGFYSSRNKATFRLKSEHAQLSSEVIAEVTGYERLETEGDVPKYLIRADRAKTFADNHQELENVFFQTYDPNGAEADRIVAAKALYIPEENKNFTAYLAGSVDILTRDHLNVKTEHIIYTRSNEIAESEELVSFSRQNIKGRSRGALVKIAEKRLELPNDVEIEAFDSAGTNRTALLNAASAAYDQIANRIELAGGIKANILRDDRTTDVTAGSANVMLVGDAEPTLSVIELNDDVAIRSAASGGKPTVIRSAFASYDRIADRFVLRGKVNIVTVEGEESTNITSDAANYDQKHRNFELFGSANVSQGNELITADSISGELNPQNRLRTARAVGNAFLKQSAAERTVEVSAREVNAAFNEQQFLSLANSRGDSTAVLTPVNSADISVVRISSPNGVDLWFKGPGLIDRAASDGRTTIDLNVPDDRADAANKRLTADTVRTFFDDAGKFLRKAEAIGNADLDVLPLRSGAEIYSSKISAPRFDCDFFENSNNARSCVAAVNAKAVRKPTQPVGGKGDQELSASRVTAVFSPQNRDVERIEASGNAKFTELDRTALAERFTFTAGDGVVRLRGGEPTAWDSRARAKAAEIDWNTRDQRSSFRGKVSTTYYNQKQTGGAAPFAQDDRPVYLTADSAEFDHRTQTGKYIGNARGWQEDNYVRANSFFIDQNEGRFLADGAVQSALYNVKRKEGAAESNVPVFASSRKMSYTRDSRLLRYEDSVDIRQGTDRITGAAAQIFLNERNEVARSVIENDVVITQPKRRATGNYAEYIATDETVLLRGSPAVVDDAENGSSSGGEIRVFLRDNRVTGSGKSKQNSVGRIRSVYKVKN